MKHNEIERTPNVFEPQSKLSADERENKTWIVVLIVCVLFVVVMVLWGSR